MRLFPGRLARQNFIILIFSTLLLACGFYYVFTSYSHLQRRAPNPNVIANETIKIVNIAKQLSSDQFRLVSKSLRHPHLRLQLVKASVSEDDLTLIFDNKKIKEFILKNPNQFRLRYPFSDEEVLIIKLISRHSSWLEAQFVSMLVLLSLVLIAVYIWVIKRMTMPLDNFSKASSQFAKDLNSPPLAETGMEQVDEAVRAFNQMQEKVRKLMQDRTQMLAAISHDLRTPITRLRLRTENLTIDGHEKIESDLDEMEKMIYSILAFARDYTHEESRERFDLVSLLDALVDDMQGAGLPVQMQSQIESQVIEGRMNALRRAFSNLIDNAIKYGEDAQIEVQAKDNQVIIHISDHGPGIEDAETEKVFLPFYRTDKARDPKKPGTGLGLAVTKEILNAHDAAIQLRNRSGGGLIVTVSFQV